MFTGIIEALGSIEKIEDLGGDIRVRFSTPGIDFQRIHLGDSIAVNGVCLTVIELPGNGFVADLSRETMAVTTAGEWREGSQVNMEPALTAASMLGGHIVSGHVDGIGEVVSRHSDARSERFRLRAPVQLARYIAHKGSVAIDGVSLTVNGVEGAEFEINIVPHTLEQTIIDSYRPGTRFNLEVDVIARYLERLLQGDNAANA
jgi:riboflavin synthase